MSGGRAELDAFIERVEALGKMNEAVAKEAEEPVGDVVRENIRAGRAPGGDAWAERQEGGRALQGAAAALETKATGSRIVLSIGRPYVFHNWGAGGASTTKEAQKSRERTARKAAASGTKSKFHAPRRQILPAGGESLPEPIREAISEAAERVFEKVKG